MAARKYLFSKITEGQPKMWDLRDNYTRHSLDAVCSGQSKII